jgi:hypothetical protein
VPRRTYRGKATRMDSANRQVHGGQYAARAGSGRIPRSAARHRIRVEPPSSSLGDYPDRPNVGRVMRELELLDGRVAPLEMRHFMKQLRIFAQRSRNGAQTPDVLGMIPAGVVSTAIAVGDERGPPLPRPRAGRLLYRSPAAVGEEKGRAVLRGRG